MVYLKVYQHLVSLGKMTRNLSQDTGSMVDIRATHHLNKFLNTDDYVQFWPA